MPLISALRRLALCLTFTATAAVAQTPAPPPPRPVVRLVAPQASQPLQLKRVDVQATIAGSQAQTQIELVVHNPNARVLEATLEFPLAEGQSVTGFALDINGELVSAVPVPKDKGRQVFDDVTRQRVDPALLERTAGNSFKLRIFPVPPGGERHVQLQLAESLSASPLKERAGYRLPLAFDQAIEQLDARIALRGRGRLEGGDMLAGAERFEAPGESGLRLQRRNWQPGRPLDVNWLQDIGPSILVQRHAGSAYGYAEVAEPFTMGAKALPRQLSIVWDASGSGAQRDHAREFALLDALFAQAGRVQVRLTVTRDTAEPARRFEVRGGDWAPLRRALETLPYDGATSAAAWSTGFAPAGPAAATLLFSDGLANWPEAEPPRPGARAPVYAIVAAGRFDTARLRRLAEAQGGSLIDLRRTDENDALLALTVRGPRLVDLRADGAEQVVVASRQPVDGRFIVAARLTSPKARLHLTLEDGQGRRSERTLDLAAPPPDAAPPDDTAVPLAAHRWAELRVDELEADRPRHRADIRRLGEQFRLLSSETSLIVLDNLADYVRHEIVPPTAAMREAYRRQLTDRAAVRGREREQHLDALVARFAERSHWWEKSFWQQPKPFVPPPPCRGCPPPPDIEPTPPILEIPPIAAASMAAPAPAIVAQDIGRFPDARVAESMQRIPGVTVARGDSEEVVVAGVRAVPKASDSGSGQPASIALRRWEPDAAYARRLREAADTDRYAVYLDERAGYTNSTAFFIDAAEIFFAKGQKALALRVLSNLAEMELENRHILRILAYRLLQADELALAVPLLERVRELAPDEPQSTRDLALALARARQPQRAVDLLWDVASGVWDGRFADIDLIALGELNAIGATRPQLDMSRVDPRLRRNLPLDLRTVLTWDADNTDIDLWVIDPDGEKAYFAHQLTRIGGAMSRDFTAGYGPEEFSLRRAKPGRYEVRANFFGHNQQLVSPYTTLMLWLSTGFGTAAQKDARVVLRLSGRGDGVLVGSFEVGKPAR